MWVWVDEILAIGIANSKVQGIQNFDGPLSQEAARKNRELAVGIAHLIILFISRRIPEGVMYPILLYAFGPTKMSSDYFKRIFRNTASVVKSRPALLDISLIQFSTIQDAQNVLNACEKTIEELQLENAQLKGKNNSLAQENILLRKICHSLFPQVPKEALMQIQAANTEFIENGAEPVAKKVKSEEEDVQLRKQIN